MPSGRGSGGGGRTFGGRLRGGGEGEDAGVDRDRVQEAVAAVGDKERVIAGGDCGFGTFTGREWVIEPVVWLKLQSIRDGADIASARLWGRKTAG